MRPHNLTLVMIGAGILWFGWFGFNAGSALSAAAPRPRRLGQHPRRHLHGHGRLAPRGAVP